MHRTYSMRQSRAPTVSPFPSTPSGRKPSHRGLRGRRQKLTIYRPRSSRIPLLHHRARSLDGCLERAVSVSAFSISSMTWPPYIITFPSHNDGIVRMRYYGVERQKEQGQSIHCARRTNRMMYNRMLLRRCCYKRGYSAASPAAIAPLPQGSLCLCIRFIPLFC